MPRCSSCQTVQPSSELRKWPSGARVCKDTQRCEQRRDKSQLALFGPELLVEAAEEQ